ncbi:ParB/RepB/Spo0J family partition protein [Microbacterium halophytorum]|uniref:ParB/RepB/Spo0J family partition protein n=1 Tax=Microbacterium halophytorum TaxID=2067568 RepID=UPI000CFD87CB|nr:ParB N-terminal domain-containing protein [Microbacterium halophytorum]
MATTYDPHTAPGELVTVESDKLVIDPNVRRDINLDKSFISSIRQYGIHQPPVGWRDDEGLVHITMGQRRTSAALEIGHDVVHVIVKPRSAAEGDRAEELRIISQLAENEQRSELSTAETAAAYKQLALFHMSAGDINVERVARKTNRSRKTIETALAVAGSEAATSAASEFSLTLDQAALLAEFDGDQEAQDRLAETATTNPDQLPHVAQRLRDDRADAAVVARLIDDARAAGYTPVTAWQDMPDSVAPVHRLYPADDEEKRPIGDEPDLAGATNVHAFIVKGYSADGAPEDRGHRVDLYVDGWKAQGFLDRWGNLGNRPQTDEDKEAIKEERRAKREAKKAMIAATAVRREWLRDTLLARGAKYDDTHRRYIAGDMLRAAGHLHGHNTEKVTLELLSLDPENYVGNYRIDRMTGRELVRGASLAFESDLEHVDPTRIALAAAVAASESVVGNEKADDFGRDPRTSRYLARLRDWGYTLSDVEQAIVSAAEERVAAAVDTDETGAA